MVRAWVLQTILGTLLTGQAPVVEPLLVGRITDAVGCPLGGVTVHAKAADGSVEGRATTTTDGTFRIDGVSYGHVEVSAEMRGFEPARGTVEVRARGGVWDASLNVGRLGPTTDHQVAGVVRSSEGRAIPGATVSVVTVFGATLIRQVRADANGEYAVDLRAGRYMLMAAQPGFEGGAEQIYLVGNATGRRVDFRLPAARVCDFVERPAASQNC